MLTREASAVSLTTQRLCTVARFSKYIYDTFYLLRILYNMWERKRQSQWNNTTKEEGKAKHTLTGAAHPRWSGPISLIKSTKKRVADGHAMPATAGSRVYFFCGHTGQQQQAVNTQRFRDGKGARCVGCETLSDNNLSSGNQMALPTVVVSSRKVIYGLMERNTILFIILKKRGIRSCRTVVVQQLAPGSTGLPIWNLMVTNHHAPQRESTFRVSMWIDLNRRCVCLRQRVQKVFISPNYGV